MPLIKKNLNDKVLIFIILIFSLCFNQYFGNRGVFPADSFAFFDSGYRILNGEFPFKDYWVVSGVFIDYFQAFLFFLFGYNWQVYVLQASLVNALFSVLTFFILKKFKLDSLSSFFYCICLSILAYPTSGTPFVDHHSAFLSFIAVYVFILAIKENKKIYWLLIPFIFGFAFLSKQVPTAYIIASTTVVFVYNSFFSQTKENIRNIFLIISSFLLFILILLLTFKLSGITLTSFIQQYLIYPTLIGEERIGDYEINFNNFMIKYKLIHVVFFLLIITSILNIRSKKNYFKSVDFSIFLVIFFTVISLIVHQILTKNQNFIFFLIPILSALAHIEINKIRVNFKRYFVIFLIIFCTFASYKYNKRFNIDRKFHELVYVDFKNAINAKNIDNKFYGLSWITPSIKNKEQNIKEVENIKEIKNFLREQNDNNMLISNYSFFSILLNKSINAPNRWYPTDGTAFPIKNSKYFNNYKKFFINLLKKNNIKTIYTSEEIEEKIIFDYLSEECFEKKKIKSFFISYELNKNCKDLK